VALLSCSVELASPAADARLRALVDVAFPCNLRCAGCRRAGGRGPPNRAALAAVAAQLAGVALQEDVRDVTAVFFGGEPLLDVEALADAASLVRDACAVGARGFEAAVITNGLLLDRVTAGRLAAAGFTTAQLTLLADRRADGHRAVDVQRLARVIRNARAARDVIDVLLRMEVSGPEELREALALVRVLEQEGLLAPPRPAAVLLGPPAPYAVQAQALFAAPAARRAALAARGQSPMMR